MDAPTRYTLTFSYDEVLFVALALEHFASQSRASLNTIPDAPSLGATRQRLSQQIAQADDLVARLNEARR